MANAKTHFSTSWHFTRVGTSIAVLVSVLVGCESLDHPWKGQVYQSPSSSQNSIGSTYAPVPQILPEVELEALENLDAGNQQLGDPLEQLGIK